MIGIIGAMWNNGMTFDSYTTVIFLKDLRWFKKITMGSTIIMGRLTWESLPRKPLKGRRNIVLSKTLKSFEGSECFNSIKAALRAAGNDDVWFIGGPNVFKQAFKYSEIAYITIFPNFNHITKQTYNMIPFPNVPDDWNSLNRQHPMDSELRLLECRKRSR